MRRFAPALVLALAGCPGVTRPLERPTATVTINGGVPAGNDLQLRATLSMVNPNPVAVTLRAVDWELAFGDAVLLRDRVQRELSIPARGARAVGLVLHVPAGAVGALVERWRSGARQFSLQGVAHFETPRGDLAAMFEMEGTANPPVPPPE